jgi:exodeoxyribonuclease V beta subunit
MTYVALTRAAHHTVVWWAATSRQSGRKKTGLARLLFSDDPTAAAAADVDLPAAGSEAAAFRERVTARDAGEWISVVEVGPPGATPAPYRPQREPIGQANLRARRLERDLERAERRWSYTGLSKAAGHGDAETRSIEDPDDETGADSGADDEPVALPAAGASVGGALPADPTGSDGAGRVAGAEWDRPSPFEGLGAGREFGTMVHAVFELVDFESRTLGDDLRNRILADTSWRTGEDTVDRLVDALHQVVHTPLGPAFGDLTMAGLPPADRLDELHFDLPLAPEAAVPAARIGEVLERHLAGTPYGEWATGLADRLGHVQLQGVLTGSIDLVLRRPTDAGPSYSVVDYKTNNLTPAGEPHLLRHYDPSDPTVVRRAMLDTNYALQAVVYSVVLHRYLRWRQPDYDPAIHLGPVGYFFVRGMVGPDTPVEPTGGRSGVVSWKLPVGLIEELDTLLARGGAS